MRKADRSGVPAALLATVAHGIAFVVLSIVVGQAGTPLRFPARVASRAQAEHLRFIVPASPVLAPRTGSTGGGGARRRVAADMPRENVEQLPTTTGAPTMKPASAAAVGPTVGALTTPLAVDPRLLVVPGLGNTLAEARVHEVNAVIASRIRALADSVSRARRRWTVGVDTTHRFGIANCGIVVDVICIPFGVNGSLPNPANAGPGIDLKHAADEAEVRAAIARIRPSEGQP